MRQFEDGLESCLQQNDELDVEQALASLKRHDKALQDYFCHHNSGSISQGERDELYKIQTNLRKLESTLSNQRNELIKELQSLRYGIAVKQAYSN